MPFSVLARMFLVVTGFLLLLPAVGVLWSIWRPFQAPFQWQPLSLILISIGAFFTVLLAVSSRRQTVTIDTHYLRVGDRGREQEIPLSTITELRPVEGKTLRRLRWRLLDQQGMLWGSSLFFLLAGGRNRVFAPIWIYSGFVVETSDHGPIIIGTRNAMKFETTLATTRGNAPDLHYPPPRRNPDLEAEARRIVDKILPR